MSEHTHRRFREVVERALATPIPRAYYNVESHRDRNGRRWWHCRGCSGRATTVHRLERMHKPNCLLSMPLAGTATIHLRGREMGEGGWW